MPIYGHNLHYTRDIYFSPRSRDLQFLNPRLERSLRLPDLTLARRSRHAPGATRLGTARSAGPPVLAS